MTPVFYVMKSQPVTPVFFLMKSQPVTPVFYVMKSQPVTPVFYVMKSQPVTPLLSYGASTHDTCHLFYARECLSELCHTNFIYIYSTVCINNNNEYNMLYTD